MFQNAEGLYLASQNIKIKNKEQITWTNIFPPTIGEEIKSTTIIQKSHTDENS